MSFLVKEASAQYQANRHSRAGGNPVDAGVPIGYKQTEVGVIPEEWEVGSLDEFWSVTDCKHVTAKFIPNGYPVASIQEVQSRYVDLSNAKQTTDEFYKLLTDGKRKLECGDLILSRNATVGEVAQVMEWHPMFAMGQDVCLLRRKLKAYSPSFLQELFEFSSIKKQLDDCMVGTTFKRVNVKQVKELLVQMPKPEEQTAIANALCDVDALITSLEKLIAKKRAIKTAAMQQLLTGKKRLPGFEDDWKTVSMNRDADLKARIGWQALTTAEYLDQGNFYLVTGTDFKGGRVNWSTCHYVDEWRYSQDRNIQLKNGDVLLTKDGTIGKVGYVDKLDSPATLNSGVFVIRPVQNTFNPMYLFYVLSSRIFDDFLNRITAGSTITHLYQKDFVTFEFEAPNLQEQIQIAAVFSSMDDELEKLDQRLNKTQQLKQGMMQELLTGRTRLI